MIDVNRNNYNDAFGFVQPNIPQQLETTHLLFPPTAATRPFFIPDNFAF
jgi:hypothetical protein